MTNRFNKFEKWLTPLKEDGRRGIRKDAPEHIKEEAKKVNEEYCQRTGRYVLHYDKDVSTYLPWSEQIPEYCKSTTPSAKVI